MTACTRFPQNTEFVIFSVARKTAGRQAPVRGCRQEAEATFPLNFWSIFRTEVWTRSRLLPDHVFLQITQHPQLAPIRSPHPPRAGRAFFTESLSPILLALEDAVHEFRRTRDRAIAEPERSGDSLPQATRRASETRQLAHPVTQDLLHRHRTLILPHGLDLSFCESGPTAFPAFRVRSHLLPFLIQKEAIPRRSPTPIALKIRILQGFAQHQAKSGPGQLRPASARKCLRIAAPSVVLGV